MKFSVVIPCYNECANLPSLINYILPLQKDYELEYILVENGSTDKSKDYFKNHIEGKYKNINVEYVITNKGYGFGLKQGLKSCKGQYLGWIHADMQVSPNDLRKFFDQVLKYSSVKEIFFKGRRLNRPLIDRFFTAGQSIFSSIIFQYRMRDIGATPVIFTRSLIDNYNKMPNDFAVELFTYLSAKKKKFLTKRFDIKINDRKNSVSSWNSGLMSKIKLSVLLIKSSILIKIKDINKSS